MNNISAGAKLLCIVLIAVLLCTLGTCTLRRARTNMRIRRVEEIEEIEPTAE